MLLAPDYALPLAASRRLRRPSERAFYPLKISCRGSALRSSGRTCFLPVPTSRLATGCTDYAYKTASGRSNFLNRDPIEEAGGINLYGFVNNDPANGYDVLGNEWASFIGGLSESTKKNEAAISVLANSPSTVLANIGLFGEMRLGGVSMVDPGCSDDEMSSLPGCSVESPYGMTIYSSNDRDTVNLIRSVSHWSLDNAEWTVLLAQNGSSSPRQSAAPNSVANNLGASNFPYSGPSPDGCAIGVLQNLYAADGAQVPSVQTIQNAVANYWSKIDPGDPSNPTASQVGVTSPHFS